MSTGQELLLTSLPFLLGGVFLLITGILFIWKSSKPKTPGITSSIILIGSGIIYIFIDSTALPIAFCHLAIGIYILWFVSLKETNIP